MGVQELGSISVETHNDDFVSRDFVEHETPPPQRHYQPLPVCPRTPRDVGSKTIITVHPIFNPNLFTLLGRRTISIFSPHEPGRPLSAPRPLPNLRKYITFIPQFACLILVLTLHLVYLEYIISLVSPPPVSAKYMDIVRQPSLIKLIGSRPAASHRENKMSTMRCPGAPTSCDFRMSQYLL